jgi:ribonuclease J
LEITIYRGNKEIGGTLIELNSSTTRILIDAGYPLFLNNEPIQDEIAKKPYSELLSLGVLPDIKGLYAWDKKGFDAVIISHAHLDHYGLLKYVNSKIPVYLSRGTETLIRISQIFKLCEPFEMAIRHFNMYDPFEIGHFKIIPYLMDHSAFDAAAFEITNNAKTVIYSGDFRGHGRKAVCLNSFIKKVKKGADALLIEGTMFGRQDEKVLAEYEIEKQLIQRIKDFEGPVLFQSSGQNIDRLVTFYRTALKLKKLFIIDVYTANVLYELRNLGNNKLPYPSEQYNNIKVFFPYRLTQKIFKEIGEEYARRFSPYHISKDKLREEQNNILMACRPSMKKDIEIAGLQDGLFIYSLWNGYRDNDYQKAFEDSLKKFGFVDEAIHTSGHATIADIHKVISALEPKTIIPIHTMEPDSFLDRFKNVVLKEDGVSFKI